MCNLLHKPSENSVTEICISHSENMASKRRYDNVIVMTS